jgi:hypothetical protein
MLQEFTNDIYLHGYFKNMLVNIMGMLNAALDYAVHPYDSSRTICSVT